MPTPTETIRTYLQAGTGQRRTRAELQAFIRTQLANTALPQEQRTQYQTTLNDITRIDALPISDENRNDRNDGFISVAEYNEYETVRANFESYRNPTVLAANQSIASVTNALGGNAEGAIVLPPIQMGERLVQVVMNPRTNRTSVAIYRASDVIAGNPPTLRTPTPTEETPNPPPVTMERFELHTGTLQLASYYGLPQGQRAGIFAPNSPINDNYVRERFTGAPTINPSTQPREFATFLARNFFSSGGFGGVFDRRALISGLLTPANGFGPRGIFMRNGELRSGQSNVGITGDVGDPNFVPAVLPPLTTPPPP